MDLVKKVIAVDGKTSRRSFDGEGRPMHLVSAFASELGIVLGQLKTEEKSNEITTIPELLDLLDIADAVVTIDAMSCQTKIVEKTSPRLSLKRMRKMAGWDNAFLERVLSAEF